MHPAAPGSIPGSTSIPLELECPSSDSGFHSQLSPVFAFTHTSSEEPIPSRVQLDVDNTRTRWDGPATNSPRHARLAAVLMKQGNLEVGNATIPASVSSVGHPT